MELEEEQFEALAGDGAWYDAKVLGLLEARGGGKEGNKHRVRVEYQNCNQVVEEVVPWQHIRRRSQAFRVGQVPQCGSMVLAFQQRKSYDLYFDADVLEVQLQRAGAPQVLVEYLHGPEEGMKEWLPFQSLHCIRQNTLTFNQLKAALPGINAAQDLAAPGDATRGEGGVAHRSSGGTASGGSATSRAFGGGGSAARRHRQSRVPLHASGPPYLCCVCSKAFNHPPAHSSHERTHMLQIKSENPHLWHLLQNKLQNGHHGGAPVPPPAQNLAEDQLDACLGIEDKDVREGAAETRAGDAGPLAASACKGQGDVSGGPSGGDAAMRNAAPNAGSSEGTGAESKGATEKAKRNLNLDMKQILLTWKTADDEHIKEFKMRLREKHPHVSQDAKMCSDTQLLVDGSGIIRDKVVIDENGDPTLRECTEKERALTLKILRSQEHTRKMATREMDRARKEYTRFHLPLTLEAVRELGRDLRAAAPLPHSDKRHGPGRVQRLHTFSSAGGRWWAPTLDSLLDLSSHAVNHRPSGGAGSGQMSHGAGALSQTQARRPQHLVKQPSRTPAGADAHLKRGGLSQLTKSGNRPLILKCTLCCASL